MTRKMLLAVLVLLLSLSFIACESPCAHGGDMIEKTVKKATCTEAGVIQTICANCGTVVRSTTVDYGGHDWKETVKEASCKEAGLISIVCTRCGEKKQPDEVLAKLPHDWDNPDFAFREPTCTLDGGMFRTCKTCGTEESLTDDVIKAQGHKYETDFVVAKEATCSEEGLETRECGVCGFIEEKAIDMLPHTWGEYINQKEATCTEQGWENRTCGVCGSVEGRSIELKPHEYTYTEEDITIPPTCTTLGEANGKCKTCDKTEVVSIKRKGHEFAGNECTICHVKKGSDKLLYTLQTPTDGNEPYYTVSKGECTASEIIIADIWREGGYDENADSPWLLVTAIEDEAFKSDYDEIIKSITIPETISEIGAKFIQGCFGLTKLEIYGDVRFENMKDWITYNASGTNSMPDRIWVDYIKNIPNISTIDSIRTTVKVGDEFVDDYDHLVKVFYVSDNGNTIYAVDPMGYYNNEYGFYGYSDIPVNIDDVNKDIRGLKYSSTLPDSIATFERDLGNGIRYCEVLENSNNAEYLKMPSVKGNPTIWVGLDNRRTQTGRDGNRNTKWFIPSAGELREIFINEVVKRENLAYWTSNRNINDRPLWDSTKLDKDGVFKNDLNVNRKGVFASFLALDLSATSI